MLKLVMHIQDALLPSHTKISVRTVGTDVLLLVFATAQSLTIQNLDGPWNIYTPSIQYVGNTI